MSVIEPFVRWWRSAARRPQRSLSVGAEVRTRRRRWIERFSDRSRRVTTAILRAQQEATLDGILIVDAAGKVVSYNRRFLELWNIPAEVARSAEDAKLLAAVQNRIVDWESFIALVHHLYDHPLEVRSNDIIELTDGRIFARTTAPVLSGRKIIGRAWYFRDITEARRNETLQSALFRISEVAHAAPTLEELYGSIHRIVGELMDVTNFYIATVDDNGLLWFPYFVDQYDAAPPVALNPGRGLTGYVMRTGRSLLVDDKTFREMVEAGEVEDIGSPSVDWLGVPLKSGDRTYGVVGVQSYDMNIRYGPKEKEILEFVSQHVASAIDHRRKEEALRENEIRYRQMFENNSAIKLVVDPSTGLIMDANAAACTFYGYSYAELRSKRIWDINLLPREVLRERMQEASSGHRTFPNFQHRLASGEIRDVEVHTGPLEIHGRKLLFSIIHDVTERRRAERALQFSEAKYRNIFDYASVGIYQATADGRLITANQTLAFILGYESTDELLQKRLPYDVFHDASLHQQMLESLDPTEPVIAREILWRKKDGSPVWVKLNAHAVKDESGRVLYFEGFVDDVSDRKTAEETMRTQAVAMEASMDGVAILDDLGRFNYVNESFLRLYGYGAATDLLGRHWRIIFTREELARLLREALPGFKRRGEWRGEGIGKKRSGITFPQEMSLTRIENGGTVCVVRDITERTYAEEQIKHLAYHDALTGLPNRLLFRDRVNVALSHANRAGKKAAVIFLDLDRFKIINDSLGHNAGDHLLQNVAARIQNCVRESDTLARLGGDEFTLLLPQLSQAEDAVKIAQKILDAVRVPFTIDGRDLYVTTSIGISLFPDDGTDSNTLIKNADTAMYQAKELGRNNYQLFNAAINAKALERLALENGLRKAIANGEFVLYYQPIFDLRNGRIAGSEALLRWQHPDLGLVAPSHFIPLAESTGLMIPIGEWAIREACRQTVAWHAAGFRNLACSVNVSMSQLLQPELAQTFGRILEESKMPPRQLALEITESTAMQNPESSILMLHELKKLGVEISLDDFGIGHSSLSYLKRFPIDTLKIDQSFIRDIATDPDTASIVTAIIAMGHKLRLKIIAEGVEQEAQRTFLNEHQCDQMQGFLFRPPLAADDFEALLYEHNSRMRQWERASGTVQ